MYASHELPCQDCSGSRPVRTSSIHASRLRFHTFSVCTSLVSSDPRALRRSSLSKLGLLDSSRRKLITLHQSFASPRSADHRPRGIPFLAVPVVRTFHADTVRVATPSSSLCAGHRTVVGERVLDGAIDLLWRPIIGKEAASCWLVHPSVRALHLYISPVGAVHVPRPHRRHPAVRRVLAHEPVVVAAADEITVPAPAHLAAEHVVVAGARLDLLAQPLDDRLEQSRSAVRPSH